MSSSFHQIRAFAHIVREGTLAAAARKLGISQSAVTQHLSRLEERVGARLLVRGRNGGQLTATGKALLPLSEELTRLDEKIEAQISLFAGAGAGHLKIIANAPKPALALIEEFNQLFPNVEVEFTLYDWTTAMTLCREGVADIGVITAPIESDDLYVTELERAKFVLVCPSDHPFATRHMISLRDLGDEVLLLPEHGSLTERVVGRAFSNLQIRRTRVVRTTTFPVMKEAVLQGVGVGIFLEGSGSREQLISEVPIKELPDEFRTCIVVPKPKMEFDLIRRFAQLG